MTKRMTILLIAMLAGCSTPKEVIDSIVWRQRAVVSNLPEAERARMITPAQPITTPPAAELADVTVLDLRQARQLALKTNPDIHAARARLESALASIDEARSYFSPQLGFFHNSSRTFQTPVRRTRITSPLTSVPDTPQLPENPTLADYITAYANYLQNRPSISSGNTNSYSDHTTTFSASWTVFDGLAREARLSASKNSFLATAMSLADAQRLLVQAVDQAYYQVQLGTERLRIAKSDEEFSRKQLADAKRRFEAKKITKASVLNFEVRVRAAQANIVAAIGLRNTGRVVLAQLLALPQAQLPERIELAPLVEEEEKELETPTVEYWIDLALNSRPDLAQARHIRNAQADNINLVRSRFSPELVLSGSWGFENIANVAYSNSDQASAVALELRWQLFTGGYRTSQLRQARAEWWKATADLESKRLEVCSETRQAIVDLINAQEQVILQRLNLKSAFENRSLVEAEYESGKATLVRLNEAQRDYIQTEVDLSEARIQLRQAWTDLRAAASTFRLPEQHEVNTKGETKVL